MKQLTVGLILLTLLVGCDSAPSIPADVLALVERDFALDETGDAIGVRELRQQLAAGTLPEGPVTIVGIVGGMPNPYDRDMQPDFPWVEGQAALFVIDKAVAAEFKDHQHDDPEHQCSFCERKAKQNADGVMLVQFHGDDGNVLPYAASELFQLQPLQTVAVRGQASLMMGELLVVDASGMTLVP